MSFRRKPPPGNVRRVICLGNNVRGVTTNKRGHLVQFESEQERKLILLLERDVTVADYLSQPETFHFQDDQGHQRRYTPDFKVWRANEQIELHEVTVTSRRKSHETLVHREQVAQAICGERGWRYLVHTEQTLPDAQEYANLNCLSAFRAATWSSKEHSTWWLEQLAGKGPVHPRAVLSWVTPNLESGSLLNTLYHLLWHGAIQMDWRQPFFWRDDFHPAAWIWLPAPGTVKELTR